MAEDEDWTLLAADYSQIELRILAHYSRDAGLMSAFRNGEDIHAATAASVYDVGIGDVDAEMRRVAKIMNFGVLYGLSPFGIRQQTGFSAEEGKAVHRHVLHELSGHPGIHRRNQGTGARAGLCRYADGPATAHQRDSLAKLSHAGCG